MNREAGFTLIELLIAMFIIGLLAAIAIPTYISYSTRSKIAEGLNVATTVQKDVALFWVENGAFPNSNALAGSSVPQAYTGAFIESVTVEDDGVVSVLFSGSALLGGIVELTPSTSEGSISWVCSSPNISQNLLPYDCRD